MRRESARTSALMVCSACALSSYNEPPPVEDQKIGSRKVGLPPRKPQR
eukprot:CAMPEP_0116863256 /NCGR_PEP_ID=MMETSP0418-20121206/24117_1 /TAXON_ID=1158023 /ORGANISM="Astrosyne radiata, Strain 13vi08-1A" /LENGTH=47 /DNA_ID= /DNA_START= /DNA_END= /DNA_ORIENTATION=